MLVCKLICNRCDNYLSPRA